MNSINESHVADGDFTSIALKEITPISVFRNFFTKEILRLITDQTNIYGKDKKRKQSEKKVNSCQNRSKKDIKFFLQIIILMGINDLPELRLH